MDRAIGTPQEMVAKARSTKHHFSIAELVITLVHDGKQGPLVDTAWYLVKAPSPEEALMKAMAIGYCYPLDSDGPGDPHVVFWGVLQLTRVAAPPADGVELRRLTDVYVGRDGRNRPKSRRATGKSRALFDGCLAANDFYSVDVVRRTKVNGRWRAFGEVATYLVSAGSSKKAYRKAVKLALASGRAETDAAGNRVETVFDCVLRTSPCQEPPIDESLLRWDFGIPVSEDELSEMAAIRDQAVEADVIENWTR
jgi:hypothetical protein